MAVRPLKSEQKDKNWPLIELDKDADEPGPPPIKVAKVARSAVKNATIDDKEWCDRYDALRAEHDSTVKKLREEKDQLRTLLVDEVLDQRQVAEKVKANLAEVTELKDDLQQHVVSIGECLKVTFEKIQLEADPATANEQQHQSLRSYNKALVELVIDYRKALDNSVIREKNLEETLKACYEIQDEQGSFIRELFAHVKSNHDDYLNDRKLVKSVKHGLKDASIRVQAEHVSLSTKLEAISTELITAKQENKELGEKLKGANEGLLDANGRLDAKQGQIADLEIELSKVMTLKESSDIQGTELKSQVASIQLELEEVKAQKEVAVNEAGSLSSKLLTIQEELDHTRAQYSKVDAKAEEQVAKLSAEAPSVIEFSEHSAIISNLSQANFIYAAQIQRLQLDLENKKDLEKVLKEKKKELKEANSLVAHLQRLQPQIDELRQTNAKKTKEIEALEIKLNLRKS